MRGCWRNVAVAVLLAGAWYAGIVMAVEGKRAAELVHLLEHDCGSCHGMRLTGGLGPDLTGLAAAGHNLQSVYAVIREGRAGTAMPPFGGVLEDAEIRWLSRYLLTQGATGKP